tara:strand:- start:14 stop:580 length:567 start_codon:yes stop_codon:yes gene_type:complete
MKKNLTHYEITQHAKQHDSNKEAIQSCYDIDYCYQGERDIPSRAQFPEGKMSHHFAFVDPSGTVVYPKGTKRHMFSRCMDWTLQGIPHGIVAVPGIHGEADTELWNDWVEANRVNKLVYIGPWGALGQDDMTNTDPYTQGHIWGRGTGATPSLRYQLQESGTGVSYNFETGIVTDKYGVKYKNGERVE